MYLVSPLPPVYLSDLATIASKQCSSSGFSVCLAIYNIYILGLRVIHGNDLRQLLLITGTSQYVIPSLRYVYMTVYRGIASDVTTRKSAVFASLGGKCN